MGGPSAHVVARLFVAVYSLIASVVLLTSDKAATWHKPLVLSSSPDCLLKQKNTKRDTSAAARACQRGWSCTGTMNINIR